MNAALMAVRRRLLRLPAGIGAVRMLDAHAFDRGFEGGFVPSENFLDGTATGSLDAVQNATVAMLGA